MEISLNNLKKIKGIGEKTIERVKKYKDKTNKENFKYNNKIKISENKIYKGDSLELMKGIKNESIDLVVTDPPYKLVEGGRTDTTFQLNSAKEDKIKSGFLFNENNLLFEQWMPHIFRILKDASHFYCMTNDRNLKEVIIQGENAGFDLLNVLVWNKGMHSLNRYYLKNIEFIVMFRKGRAKTINKRGSFSLINIKGIRGNKKHPSEKPTELFSHLIENSSKENEIVFDPFLGVGTTCVSAKRLNRKYIGIELDNKYYNIASERLG